MRRKKREIADHGVDLAIIITPMLDLAFQMLAFFIMTYHPPAREGIVDGTLLPAARPTLPKTGIMGVQVIVRASADGQPTAVYLQTPKSPTPRLIADIGTSENFVAVLQLLTKELAASRAMRGDHDLPLCLVADRTLGYGHFIAVQDAAKAAGVKTIEFRAASVGER